MNAAEIVAYIGAGAWARRRWTRDRYAVRSEAVVIRRTLALALLLGVASGSATAADPVPATETVRLWLGALHDGNVDAFESLTALPFIYREAWPKKQCTRVAKDPVAVKGWLECARKKEGLLIEELRREQNDPSHVHLGLGSEAASKKLRALAKGTSGKTWVNGFINGDGVTYEFLFAIDGDASGGRRVAAMYIDASFESG